MTSGQRLPVIVLGSTLLLQTMWRAGELNAPDLWWHLRTGDLILDGGGVPRSDPFSWTAADDPWQPNAWLADVLMALLRRGAGLEGVALFRALSVMAIGLALYLLIRRRQGRPWPAMIVSALATLLMNPFIVERPQVLGFALFPWLMVASHSTTSNRALLGLGLLSSLWVNLHGSFVVGVAVLLLMTLGRLARRAAPLRSVIIAAVSLVATLVNPYGYHVYLHALAIARSSRFIDEWQPLSLGDPRGIMVAIYMAALVIALWRTEAWRRLDLLLPLVALGGLTLHAIRSAPFLLMAGAPVIAQAAGQIRADRLRAWARARRSPMILGAMAAWAALLVMIAPTLGRLGTVSGRFPVRATAAIPAGCRLLNEYAFGGYVIDRRWPEVRVSLDGRNDMYGPTRIREQQRLLSSLDAGPLDRLGVRCVLLRRTRPLVTALRSHPGWRLRASDASALLFVREDRP